MANIGYIRVSTVQQNTDRQLAGVTLDKVFEDKASGKNTQRPQFEAMMNYVREGDVLHVHSIDRLCRNTADLLATVEQLTERGVSVHFHKEDFKTGKNSPAGNMMLTVLAAVAQMEREMMLERQREGSPQLRPLDVQQNVVMEKQLIEQELLPLSRMVDQFGAQQRFQCQHTDGATYQERAGSVMPPDISELSPRGPDGADLLVKR